MGAERGEARGGTLATAFAALKRHRGTVARATGRVVGLSALTGLLMTVAVFALAWPVFTRMRDERIRYRQLEDPYLHDTTGLLLVALCALPLFLLLMGTGGAALQTVCSRAVAARKPEGPARRRQVLTVYALRGLAVWSPPLLVGFVAHSLTGYQLDTPLPLERGSLPYTLVEASPVAAVGVAVLLRLSLSLAPAAAAAGLGPRAALRSSWALTRSRAGAAGVLALALPLAALTAGALRLVTQLALPLRPLVRGLVEQATGNFFAAYYAGILAPVMIGIVVSAALALPLACTAFASLDDRLRSPGTPPGGMVETKAVRV
ncbi:hypothetical protein ACFYVL_34280 [Streptomyces sp. NPDC004111]|uniref:hypothetical protein n=1 Tax=Streptomyces sp. NPDC004111 TaxID=3364690 RepID=UPI00367D5287